MDVETTAAIEGLRSEVHDLRDEVHTRFDEIHDRFDSVATKVELRSEIASVRADMAVTREELKRHTAVMTESLRDDIRIVAEGLAALSAQINPRA